MIGIVKSTRAEEKLAILSRDAQYDLACACATGPGEHRRRSQTDQWIYPVILPGGGRTFLFKTLLSNACVNDCRYCPLRAGSDARRCSLSPEEMTRIFLSYYRARKVSGLFLSSAVSGNPDEAMERINRTASALRKREFRGYIHLKIIPGASGAAIRESLSLATAVSLNIETPGAENFRHLSSSKDYLRDIIGPIRLISALTAKGSAYEGVHQTTQFVVGASEETDKEILGYSWRLYKGLRLSRVYFSAYQRGQGSRSLPGERSQAKNGDLLTREHRLYQADWLIRKYGFSADEIPLDSRGNLSLVCDPKEAWAKEHPEFFPVNLNTDAPYRMLRVPGLGQVITDRVMAFRKAGAKIRSLGDLGRVTKVLKKAETCVTF
jgi:predicted DNA-binding helix-hairpin-helix protein